MDLSDVHTPHEVAANIHEAVFLGRFVEPAVHDAMQRANGRHNLHVLELVNTKVLGIEVDFLWPDLKLNVKFRPKRVIATVEAWASSQRPPGP